MTREVQIAVAFVVQLPGGSDTFRLFILRTTLRPFPSLQFLRIRKKVVDLLSYSEYLSRCGYCWLFKADCSINSLFRSLIGKVTRTMTPPFWP